MTWKVNMRNYRIFIDFAGKREIFNGVAGIIIEIAGFSTYASVSLPLPPQPLAQIT